MDNELQPTGQTPAVQGTRPVIDWTPEQVQLLKDTVARGSTDDEFKMFLYVCSRTGLDPFLRQIHLVKRWDSNMKREVATIQTGIDGYRVIAERSGSYAGVDAPRFAFEPNTPYPVSSTVTVYRMVNGQRVGFTATAFFDEYKQTTREGRLTRFWEKMPKSQLAKCAEALALRKAFPNDLAGLYTNEEMEQSIEPSNRPATEKQLAYIESLVRNEAVPESVRNDVTEWLSGEEKMIDLASTWIDTLSQYVPSRSGGHPRQSNVVREEPTEEEFDQRPEEERHEHATPSPEFGPDYQAPTQTNEPETRRRGRTRGRTGQATSAATKERSSAQTLLNSVEQLEQQVRLTDEGASVNFDKLRQMFAGSADITKASRAGLMNYYDHLRERYGQRSA